MGTATEQRLHAGRGQPNASGSKITQAGTRPMLSPSEALSGVPRAGSCLGLAPFREALGDSRAGTLQGPRDGLWPKAGVRWPLTWA